MPKSLEGVLLMKALSLLITEEEARLCVFIIIRKKWLRVCFDKNDNTEDSIIYYKNLLWQSPWKMSLVGVLSDISVLSFDSTLELHGCVVQGDPNQNLLFQLALSLNVGIPDPMLVKPKCV